MKPDHTLDAFPRPSKPTMQLHKEWGRKVKRPKVSSQIIQ